MLIVPKPIPPQECDDLYTCYDAALETFKQGPNGIHTTSYRYRNERAQTAGLAHKGTSKTSSYLDKFAFVYTPDTLRWLEENNPGLDQRVKDLVLFLADTIKPVHKAIIDTMDGQINDGWFREAAVRNDNRGNLVLPNGILRLIRYPVPSQTDQGRLLRRHYDLGIVTMHVDSSREGLEVEDGGQYEVVDKDRKDARMFGSLALKKFPACELSPLLHGGVETEADAKTPRYVLVSQVSACTPEIWVPTEEEAHATQ
jgi:hypothetical protein